MAETLYTYDGDTVLEITVMEKSKIVDLTDSTVSVDFRVKSRTFTKSATITDPPNGICEVDLSGDDISDEGTYFFRCKVSTGTDNYHSDKGYFNVESPAV